MEMPTVFTFAKGGKLFSNMYGFQRDATVVAQCLVQCTMTKIIESSGGNKPEISQFNKSMKGEVGTMDHVFRYYCTKHMTRRWPMVFLMTY